MESTERLRLPLLSPGQAQKELYHNEALQLIDVLLAGAVEEAPRATPPAVPLVGQRFIVGPQPTGDWSNYANHVAAFTSGGWRFVAPAVGTSLYVRDAQTVATYAGGNWTIGELRGTAVYIGGEQVVGPRMAAISDPAGGALIDGEARSAIGAILSALRMHGLISQPQG